MGAYDDILNERGSYDDILEPQSPPKKRSTTVKLEAPKKSTAKNIAGGAVQGAANIGATILAPLDYLDKVAPWYLKPAFPLGMQGRRESIKQGIESTGADPESLAFKTAKIGTEVAGTAGIGGAIAKTPMIAQNAPRLAAAIQTGGLGKNIPIAQRVAGGAISGGAMAGATNPDEAMSGAMLGAALPVGFKMAGVVGDKVVKPAARRVMQSAVKPTIEQLRKGDAKVAIDTLLDYGVSPTQKGVDILRGKVDDINADIAGRVAQSTARINKSDVLTYLGDVNKKFANQVSPSADLSAISSVADDFINHPGVTGNTLSVPLAQSIKQGTYKALKGKYGEVGSAATEAQKALARGLKDEVGKAVPGVSALNAEEARLLKTLSVAERRALMELNKNPVGLSALAGNPYGFAAFMADRSAAFKALVARMLNRTSQAPEFASGVVANPVVRSGLLQSDQ